jgi:MaoC dehydratase-like protein
MLAVVEKQFPSTHDADRRPMLHATVAADYARPVHDATEFRRQLDAFVGQPVGASGPSVAPDPVNQAMIRHWATAFNDRNPVYTDPEFARTSRFGEIVAPPLMLQTWTMATPQLVGIAERGGSPVDSEQRGVITAFDEAGYTGTLASNTEFEIERYLHLGETIRATTMVESISEQKQTRLGPGFFLTWVTTYLDDAGEVVGRQRFRILKFKVDGARP